MVIHLLQYCGWLKLVGSVRRSIILVSFQFTKGFLVTYDIQYAYGQIRSWGCYTCDIILWVPQHKRQKCCSANECRMVGWVTTLWSICRWLTHNGLHRNAKTYTSNSTFFWCLAQSWCAAKWCMMSSTIFWHLITWLHHGWYHPLNDSLQLPLSSNAKSSPVVSV